jgi:hypothetical protein
VIKTREYSPPTIILSSTEREGRKPLFTAVLIMVIFMAALSAVIQIKQTYAGAQLSNRFEGGEIYVLRSSLDNKGDLVVLISNNNDRPITIVFAYVLDSHGKLVSSGKTNCENGYTIPSGEMRFVYFKLDKKLVPGEYVVQVVSQTMGSGFSSLLVNG